MSTKIKTQTANVPAIADALETRTDFDTSGSLDGRKGRSNTFGYLPKQYHDSASEALYVVLSYATPIAWLTESGWIVPDVRYSVTTSKQQGTIRRALNRIEGYRGSDYPRTVDGRTVWACCESTIGPKCQHLDA